MKPEILLGLDDSPGCRAAHEWAVRYAEATSGQLRAVHVLDWPIGLTAEALKSGTRLQVPRNDIDEPYWQGLHRVFQDVNTTRDGVVQFAQGEVADVLVRLSAQADLLVLGSRPPLPHRLSVRGPTNHYCVNHAACPVVTVPAGTRHPTPGHRPIDSGASPISLGKSR